MSTDQQKDDGIEEEVEVEEDLSLMEAEVAKSIQPKVKEWLDIHSEIEILQKAIRERKEKKKGLDETIMKFMKAHEIPHFDLKQNKLVLNVAKKQQPLNQKWIQDVITTNCTKEQIEILTNKLFKTRPLIEKSSLKYTKPRKTKANMDQLT